jgi:hypothetical protein
MLFKKPKRSDMVDIRELQKRGVVRIPKKREHVPMTKEGFVEYGTVKQESTKPTEAKTQSNANFFGFMNSSTSSQPKPKSSFSTEQDGYSKREVDAKITDLDNKIYKLEQRIELLEKKLDVNQSSSSGVGPMGW